MDDALSFLAPLSAERCLVSARLLLIFGFTTDLGSQCGFRLCQNNYMITLSVAGLLLLLNVALISSILSFDKFMG
ncbi:hypothetical protein WB44_02290 [Synechococcus sp. WH 8020]|uniref:hypothetical protein n=1 Tax=Synechococcus sp. (strain WH8020) TaxID=32052 RepID=UPI00065276B9|nr:hypothetical protein [Synechococcus sp. WH 8020]AKN60139.1 hypothetical protein WB44_02290 [Synechococcus sp. WH 8020]